jgi:nicotinamidase-related amidase
MATKPARMAGLVMSGLLLAASAFGAVPAGAQTIVDEWSSVKTPPPPALKPVKADPKTMAFLVLDLLKQSCNNEQRPRCVASLPKVAKFLGEARAHDMPVIYSLTPGRTIKDIVDQVAPKGDEPTVTMSADKFINTDLEKILKNRGVTTVIIVGTTAPGAVLYTASHAAFLGFKVIVPVDGSTAPDAFAELAATWTLANAPAVGAATTLTRFDMIAW